MKLLLPLILATSLFAGDYDTVLSLAKKTWTSSTVAVICDSNMSKAELEKLIASANGLKIYVIDVKGPQDMGKAIATATSKKPDVIVLLSGDHVAGDGSSAASFLIQRLATQKIPTVSSSELGLKQGAVLGVVGGKVVGNKSAAAAVGVVVPSGVPVQ